MKTTLSVQLIGLMALSASFLAAAHDPKEHANPQEKPNCAAMKEMDHSKMDMSDPVMQAMMQQCANKMKTAEYADKQAAKGQEQTKAPKPHTNHQH